MLADQLRILFLFYIRPMEAAHQALDRGRPFFGAAMAIVLALLLRVVSRVGLDALLFLTIVFIPVGIAILAVSQGYGRAGAVISREYFAILTASLFGWTAAHLLLAVAMTMSGALGLGGTQLLWIRLSVYGLFIVFAGCCLSAAMGAELVPSIVSALLAGIATQVATVFLSGLPLVPLLASPWILYMLYMNLAPDVRFGFEGLRRRQNFRRHLEASTLNPRDSDAHYQLGLIYLQRRNVVEAESRFRKAVEIDSQDADYLYQLGRLLREKGQPEEAATLLERAAKINPKTANHEVWREIGAARLARGFVPQAIEALRYYTQVREYDPQGHVLLGQALRRSNDQEGARQSFQAAITAAQTSPSYRRHEVRGFERVARQELKAL